MKRYFISGIGTGVGKTVMSALLCEALQADYWKPIQAGDLENSDTLTAKGLVSNSKTHFHKEAYQLPFALSPHASAENAGMKIDISQIQVPQTNNTLVIEGAGGLMVPINYETLFIDLLPLWNVEVVLVSRHYLGSINHTLLSADLLKQRNIWVKGIVFNGDENLQSESVILKLSGLKMLGRIPETSAIDKQYIKNHASTFSNL
jgi:dethiobiotin synthetase